MKRKRQLTFFIILGACICLPLITWMLFVQKRESPYPFKLSDRLAWLEIEATSDGASAIALKNKQGEIEIYSAEKFLEQVAQAQGSNRSLPPLVFRRIFNLTSWTGVFWVCIGLFGQILFTGRMIVQWLTSEKLKRSMVPVSFWWLSLSGNLLLLAYVVELGDPVFIAGFLPGPLVQARNLWLLRRAGA